MANGYRTLSYLLFLFMIFKLIASFFLPGLLTCDLERLIDITMEVLELLMIRYSTAYTEVSAFDVIKICQIVTMTTGIAS
jgi:hypothetical protein